MAATCACSCWRRLGVDVRTRNRQASWSAAISTDNGSAMASAANRFSAEVSDAALVRGVTISTRLISVSLGFLGSIRRCMLHLQPAELGQLARGGGCQAVLSRAGLDGESQPDPAREQQTLALVCAQQVLTFLRSQLKCLRYGIERGGVLLQQ